MSVRSLKLESRYAVELARLQNKTVSWPRGVLFFLFLHRLAMMSFAPDLKPGRRPNFSSRRNRNAHNAGAPLAWRDGLARLALLQPRMVSPINRAPWLRCSHADGRPPLPPSCRDRLPNRLDALAHQRHVGPALLPRASRALQLALPMRGALRGERGCTCLHRLGGGECLRDYRACCGR